MAQPTPGDVYVDAILTNVLVAYMQDQTKFISTQVFPSVPVAERSGLYFRWKRDDWFRVQAQKRGPGTESAGTGINLDTAKFFAEVYAVHTDLDDITRSAAASVLKLEESKARFIGDQLLLKREKLWAQSFFKTGVWSTDVTGVSGTPSGGQFKQWSQAGSTPVEDVDTQVTKVEQLTGYTPNVLVLGKSVFTSLKNHAEILDRVKYTQRGVITEDLLADVFGVEKVLVARAVENTAVEGTSLAMNFMFGNGALLAYAAPAPEVDAPSAGYTFTWSGFTGSEDGARTKNFRIEQIESNRIEGELAIDPEVVAPDAGVYFATAA